MVDAAERDYRYERKFMVEGLDHHQAIALIKRHPYLFYQPYPPRYINNFYLDTPEMDNYYDNVCGAPDRRKVRLRWYGELFGPISSAPNGCILWADSPSSRALPAPISASSDGNPTCLQI